MTSSTCAGYWRTGTAMSEPGQDIDWSLTTWEGSRRAQLRRAVQTTLRERLEAVEAMTDLARRLAEMHARGEFVPVSGRCVDPQADSLLRQASPPYEEDNETGSRG